MLRKSVLTLVWNAQKHSFCTDCSHSLFVSHSVVLWRIWCASRFHSFTCCAGCCEWMVKKRCDRRLAVDARVAQRPTKRLFIPSIYFPFDAQAIETEQRTEQYVVACATRRNPLGGWSFVRQQNGFAKVKFWGECAKLSVERSAPKTKKEQKIIIFLSMLAGVGAIEFFTAAIWREFDPGIDCQLHIVAANACVHNNWHLQRWTRCHQENCQEKGNAEYEWKWEMGARHWIESMQTGRNGWNILKCDAVAFVG